MKISRLEQVHEEFWRGTLAEAAEEFTHRTPRGEITLVVAGVGPDGGFGAGDVAAGGAGACLLYTSPSPRDRTRSRMPSSA